MTIYRKKPVEIDAEPWDGSAQDAGRIIDWLLTQHPDSLVPSFWETNETEHKQHNELSIQTLEGRMKASPGDFIIVGVQGETYPCKPDIFAATYDLVGEEPSTIMIPRPHVPYGPRNIAEHLADADYLREAADHIEGGFLVGGSNLTATVLQLLRDSADALNPTSERTN